MRSSLERLRCLGAGIGRRWRAAGERAPERLDEGIALLTILGETRAAFPGQEFLAETGAELSVERFTDIGGEVGRSVEARALQGGDAIDAVARSGCGGRIEDRDTGRRSGQLIQRGELDRDTAGLGSSDERAEHDGSRKKPASRNLAQGNGMKWLNHPRVMAALGARGKSALVGSAATAADAPEHNERAKAEHRVGGGFGHGDEVGEDDAVGEARECAARAEIHLKRSEAIDRV